MFKNACIFRIADGFTLPAIDTLERALQKGRFVPCGPTQAESSGWIAPRGEKSKQLAEIIGGSLFLKLQTETRSVPAATLKAAVQAKVDAYMHETGATRVPAKLKKEFKEECLLDLLPRAFAKRHAIALWLDPSSNLLVVDGGYLSAADRIISSLLAALAENGYPMELRLVHTSTSPAGAMAHWLTNESPFAFTVDRDCELRSSDEQKSTVRYTRHTLDIEEVAQHIAAGKMPTRLAMTWNERVSFEMTDLGTLRKIKFLDVVMKDRGEDAATGFDADAAILAGELASLIPDLLLALGGEAEIASTEEE